MNKRLAILSSLLVATLACAGALVHQMETSASAAPGSAAPQTVTNAPMPAKTDANAVPVLVELFTSEGCSSCPSADVVLANLERTQGIAGARIVPLGHHVDYWDRLGWTDPFSSERATNRQQAYQSLGGGVYTPQAVVDGAAQMVGSRRGQVEAAIAEAAKKPHATVGIDLAPRTEPNAPYVATLKIGALPSGAASDAETLVVLTQNAVKVAVPKGENAGSTLEHTAIVRELVSAGATPASGATLKATLKSPPNVDAKDLRIVAFVQERGSRRVLGTATRDLDSK